MTDKDKLIEKQREALSKIAFPLKYLKDKADKEGATLNGMMALQICQDANWLKQIAEDCLMETDELEAKMKEVTDADIVKYAFNCYPDSYNMRVACVNGIRDMRDGKIKHIEK
jgi:hypothetical protein